MCNKLSHYRMWEDADGILVCRICGEPVGTCAELSVYMITGLIIGLIMYYIGKMFE
jgi:hypothetical protein